MKHTLPPNTFFKRNRDAFIAQMRPNSAAVFRARPGCARTPTRTTRTSRTAISST
jgi:hypothetical protein